MNPPSRWRQCLAAGTLGALCLLGTARALRPTAAPATIPAATLTQLHRLHLAVRATLHGTPPDTPLLLLRNDCPACHALVRTLQRRAPHRTPAQPLAIAVDRPWPELLALANAGTATLHLAPLAKQLPVTPTLAVHQLGDPVATLRIGVPGIISYLDTLHTARARP